MKVHLLKSAEVDTTLFTKVVDFLQSIPGAIQFYYDLNWVVNFEEDEYFFKRFETKEDFEKQILMSDHVKICESRIFLDFG